MIRPEEFERKETGQKTSSGRCDKSFYLFHLRKTNRLPSIVSLSEKTDCRLDYMIHNQELQVQVLPAQLLFVGR
jgi:hypothetical protein